MIFPKHIIFEFLGVILIQSFLRGLHRWNNVWKYWKHWLSYTIRSIRTSYFPYFGTIFHFSQTSLQLLENTVLSGSYWQHFDTKYSLLMWVFSFDTHNRIIFIYLRDFINFCLLLNILRNPSQMNTLAIIGFFHYKIRCMKMKPFFKPIIFESNVILDTISMVREFVFLRLEITHPLFHIPVIVKACPGDKDGINKVRRSRLQVFFKIAILKNFAIFTGK